MKPTNGHTCTFRGRRIAIVLTTGERISGRFVERTKGKKNIVLMVDGKQRVFQRDIIAQFLAGNGTRGKF